MPKPPEHHSQQRDRHHGMSDVSRKTYRTAGHNAHNSEGAVHPNKGLNENGRERRPKYAADDSSILRHKYDKLEMLKVYAQHKAYCDDRPDYLEVKFNNPENDIWNPELWLHSLWGRDPSAPSAAHSADAPQTSQGSKSTSALTARASHNGTYESQPMDRLRVDKGGAEVVLSPQRRSFGAGCQLNKPKDFGGNRATSRDDSYAGRGGRGGYMRGGSSGFNNRQSRFAEQRWGRSSRNYEKGAWFDHGNNNRREPEWMQGGPEDFETNMELKGFEEDEKPTSRSRSQTPNDHSDSSRSTTSADTRAKEGRDSKTEPSDEGKTEAPGEKNSEEGLLFGANEGGGFSFLGDLLGSNTESSSKFSKFFSSSSVSASSRPSSTLPYASHKPNQSQTVMSAASPTTATGATDSTAISPDIMNLLNRASSNALPEQTGHNLGALESMMSNPNSVKTQNVVTNLAELEAKLLQNSQAPYQRIQQQPPGACGGENGSGGSTGTGSNSILREIFGGTGDGPKIPQNAITEAELLAKMGNSGQKNNEMPPQSHAGPAPQTSSAPAPGPHQMTGAVPRGPHPYDPVTTTAAAAFMYHQQQEKLRESILKAQLSGGNVGNVHPGAQMARTPEQQSADAISQYMIRMGLSHQGLLKAMPGSGTGPSPGSGVQQRPHMPSANVVGKLPNNFNNFTPTSVLKQMHSGAATRLVTPPGNVQGGLGGGRPVVKNQVGQGPEESAKMMTNEGGGLPITAQMRPPGHASASGGVGGGGAGSNTPAPSLIDLQKMFDIQQARFLEQFRVNGPGTASRPGAPRMAHGQQLNVQPSSGVPPSMGGTTQQPSPGTRFMPPSSFSPHQQQHQSIPMGQSGPGVSNYQSAQSAQQQQLLIQAAALRAKQIQAAALASGARPIHGTGSGSASGGPHAGALQPPTTTMSSTTTGTSGRGVLTPEIWQMIQHQQRTAALSGGHGNQTFHQGSNVHLGTAQGGAVTPSTIQQKLS